MEKTNLYSVSIPPLIKSLKALSSILDKGVLHATSKSSERAPLEKQMENLLTDKLVFDQLNLTRQIQIATDNAKGAARLAKMEVPSYEDNEKTVEELKARIDKTVKFLETIKAEDVVGNEDIQVTFAFMPGKYCTGFEYVTEFLLPNFFFHVTTAYSILRKNGVEIGKPDFIGGLPMKDL